MGREMVVGKLHELVGEVGFQVGVDGADKHGLVAVILVVAVVVDGSGVGGIDVDRMRISVSLLISLPLLLALDVHGLF